MNRDGDAAAVRVIPSLVASCLAGAKESEFARNILKMARLALGMHDFRGIGGKRETLFSVLFGNHLEDIVQFLKGFLSSRHKRVAT